MKINTIPLGMDIAIVTSSWWLGFRPSSQGVWSKSHRLGREIAQVHGGIKARETSIAGLASMCLANPRSPRIPMDSEDCPMKPVSRLLPVFVAATLIAPGFCPAAHAVAKKEFNIAWTIYVGWMPWPYAAEAGIVRKWADKYDIKINVTQINDYVESINQYTAGKFDGVTLTNMDALTIPAAGGIDTTAIIMGDFSNGNDGI